MRHPHLMTVFVNGINERFDFKDQIMDVQKIATHLVAIIYSFTSSKHGLENQRPIATDSRHNNRND